MGQTEEQYHLKWNDFNSSLTKCFRDLRDNCEMLDVSIISNGKTFKAHKLVLSACSPIFKNMLQKKNLNGQPFIFLHGVRSQDVQAILDFMYNGEVSVTQEDLRSFLSVAEDLRVKGLTQNEQNNVENKPEENKSPPRKRPRQSDDEEDSETAEQTELNPRDYSSVEHHKSPNHSPTYTQGNVVNKTENLSVYKNSKN